MLSKWAYILIGDDRTGKTTFQKWLISHLCVLPKFTTLKTNLIHQVAHPDTPRKFRTLFTMNRSIQEKWDAYKNVDNYFESFFADADIVILSSHAQPNCVQDITAMIDHLHKRYFNVCGVFFSNHLNNNTEVISLLNWHERIIVSNPLLEGEDDIDQQLKNAALNFTRMLITKSNQY